MNEIDRQTLNRKLCRDQWIGLVLGALLGLLLATGFVCSLLHRDNLFGLFPIPNQPALSLLGLALQGELLLAILVVLVRRVLQKRKTGSFILSYTDQVEQWRTKYENYGPGKPFLPQSSYWLTSIFLALVLLTFDAILFYLWYSIWQLAGITSSLNWFFIVLILLLLAVPLLFPLWFVFSTLRRKVKTGSFLPTTEEMRNRYVKIFKNARNSSVSSQQSWGPILLANLYCFVAMLFLFTPIEKHLRHRPISFFDTWMLPLCWVFMAVIWSWLGFKQNKRPAINTILSILTDAKILPEEPETPEEEPRRKKGKMLAWCILPWLSVSLILGYIQLHNVHPDPVLYPPAAQAKTDLANALHSAPGSHKRVLLDFGESRCEDCVAMDRYLHDPVNLALLHENFLVVFINVDHEKPHDYTNANEDLANQYGIPLDKGIPALAVLSEDGKLIFSQQKGEFEDMRHLKSSDLTHFLERWKE